MVTRCCETIKPCDPMFIMALLFKLGQLGGIVEWHVKYDYISQPPKYSIIIVTRFRYINNNVTKDMFPIPMDMTIVLGLHNLACRLPWIITDHLCIWVVILPLSTVAKYIPLQRQQNHGVWNEWYQKDDVFRPDDLGSSLYTQFLIICIPCIIAAF